MPFHRKLAAQFESPLGQIGTFVKENPLLTGVSLIAGVSGITAVVRSVKRKRKTTAAVSRRRKRSTTRRKSVARRSPRKIRHTRSGHSPRRTRSKRVSHRSPRHRGHKTVSFVTKDGRRVKFKTKK